MLTLETSKKLKEAGWSKETAECFYDYGSNGNWQYTDSEYCNPKAYPVIYAPSLEELLVVMPDVIGNIYKFHLVKLSINFIATYLDKKNNKWKYFEIEHPDPTEAVAQLYIKLKQEGLIK